MENKTYRVLGMMSGSSLDGLDVALCRFTIKGQQLDGPPEWELIHAQTLPFPGAWQARLRQAVVLPGKELWRLHTEFGHFIGKAASDFLTKNQLEADLIGSHGHTLFHDPQKGSTTQIGEGAAIARHTGLPVVTELRTADMALGGQGAPIAPIADHFLFPTDGAFLNIGGIANICVKTSATQRSDSGDTIPSNSPVTSYMAGDVSAANQILDRLVKLIDPSYDFDPEGQIAATGKVLPDLITRLNELKYHLFPYPKSLDNGWVVNEVWPLLQDHPASIQDKLCSFCHFLAERIHTDLNKLLQGSKLAAQPIKVLVSGGGARNSFLLKCLRSLPQDNTYPLGYAVDPNEQIGDFKEAAMVALMALLRKLGQTNSFASATGAQSNAINGAMYLPPPNIQAE